MDEQGRFVDEETYKRFVRANNYASPGELEQALRTETRMGLEVIRSGETGNGAGRFARGAGRHGSFD